MTAEEKAMMLAMLAKLELGIEHLRVERDAAQAEVERLHAERATVIDHRDEAQLTDLRARLEAVTAERDRLAQRATADDRLAHRLSQQIDAAARHLGAWMALIHGPHDPNVDPDALIGRAISALLGGEE